MISIHLFFFFNDTATTEIYTLSLHDALPISSSTSRLEEIAMTKLLSRGLCAIGLAAVLAGPAAAQRSEEHTSELQSRSDLVCRLLLEKKKQNAISHTRSTHTCAVSYRSRL